MPRSGKLMNASFIAIHRRSRGTSRSRQRLHGGHAEAHGRRRLAEERHPDAGRQAVLRRVVHPKRSFRTLLTNLGTTWREQPEQVASAASMVMRSLDAGIDRGGNPRRRGAGERLPAVRARGSTRRTADSFPSRRFPPRISSCSCSATGTAAARRTRWRWWRPPCAKCAPARSGTPIAAASIATPSSRLEPATLREDALRSGPAVDGVPRSIQATQGRIRRDRARHLHVRPARPARPERSLLLRRRIPTTAPPATKKS